MNTELSLPQERLVGQESASPPDSPQETRYGESASRGLLLGLLRAEIAERRVPTLAIVEGLNVVEDRRAVERQDGNPYLLTRPLQASRV